MKASNVLFHLAMRWLSAISMPLNAMASVIYAKGHFLIERKGTVAKKFQIQHNLHASKENTT